MATPQGGINLANFLNVGSFTAQPSGTVQVSSFAITLTQAYSVITPESGTVGTVSTINLGEQAGTDTAGYLPRITLRAANSCAVMIEQDTGLDANQVSFNSGSSFHLSGEKTLDLIRTPAGRWSSTEGIQTTGSGDVVTTNGTQQLANKTITSPIVRGTLELSSSPIGFGELEYKSLGAGTKTHTAGTVTLATIGTLPVTNVMTVHGWMQGIDTTGGTTVHMKFMGGFQRPTAGTIGLVGTEVPTVIHNTGASPMALLETDGSASALIRVAAPPGTFSWTTQYFYMVNGVSL